MPLRQQPQPQILGDVGVLIFVDEDIAEAFLPLPQDIRMCLKQRYAMQQQIAEIDRVQRQQTLLIGPVQLHALAVKARPFAARNLVGRQRAVLPAVDQPGQLPRRPPLFVDIRRRDQLLQQPQLIIGIQNGEAGFQPRQFGMAAQDFHADAVEGAQPGHAFDRVAQQPADPVAHLARSFVGEGHGQDLPRTCPPGGDHMGDPGGQHARLAGPGPGQNQNRAIQRLDREALRGVQPVQIGRRPRRHPHGTLRQG